MDESIDCAANYWILELANDPIIQRCDLNSPLERECSGSVLSVGGPCLLYVDTHFPPPKCPTTPPTRHVSFTFHKGKMVCSRQNRKIAWKKDAEERKLACERGNAELDASEDLKKRKKYN